MPHSIYSSLTQDTTAAADSLAVMMINERTIYQSCDYLQTTSSSSMEDYDSMITESDRTKLVGWCYDTVDKCHFDRETVAIAIELVDRFLSQPNSMAHVALDRKQYQLIVMASLYISIKVNERVAFGSTFLSAMSKGMYSVHDIEEMELTILTNLSWRINAPTSIQMAHHILSLVLPHVNLDESTWGFILDEVRFQTESAVRDYFFVTQRPSTVCMGE